tara:strand:+ start:1663 stop:2610 length:948 start_codon:yes stop_codon:yes gene_type:complete
MLSVSKLTKSNIKDIFSLANQLKNLDYTKTCPKILSGITVTNVFFEPSTRTSMSFELAAKKLGANVLNFNYETSSTKKGESFTDTMRTIQVYSDCIVLRHPQNRKIQQASNCSRVPIINAGNGDGEHPTQALLDLYTIDNRFDIISKDSNNINIIMVGDVYKSRTISSLLFLTKKHTNMKITLCPYFRDETMEIDFIAKMTAMGITCDFNWMDIKNINNKAGEFDIFYMTRFQKERYIKEDMDKSMEKDSSICVIDSPFMRKIKGNAIILHPLPRNTEISEDVDNDDRCLYLNEQLNNGVYIRMGILAKILGRNI